MRRLLVRLEALQDVLGEAQDADMQIAWLREYAGSAQTAPPTLLPVGAIIQALARRAAKRRRQSLKSWRKLDRARLLDAAIGDLTRTARTRRNAIREAG